MEVRTLFGLNSAVKNAQPTDGRMNGRTNSSAIAHEISAHRIERIIEVMS